MPLNPLQLQPVRVDEYSIADAAKTIVNGYLTGQQRKQEKNNQLVNILAQQIASNNANADRQLQDATLTYADRDKIKQEVATTNAQLMQQLLLASNNGKPLKHKDPRAATFQHLIDSVAAQGRATSEGKGVTNEGAIIGKAFTPQDEARVNDPNSSDPYIPYIEGNNYGNGVIGTPLALKDVSPAQVQGMQQTAQENRRLQDVLTQLKLNKGLTQENNRDLQLTRQSGILYSQSLHDGQGGFVNRVYKGTDDNGNPIFENYDYSTNEKITTPLNDLVPSKIEENRRKAFSSISLPTDKVAFGLAAKDGIDLNTADTDTINKYRSQAGSMAKEKFDKQLEVSDAMISSLEARTTTEGMRQAGTLPESQTAKRGQDNIEIERKNKFLKEASDIGQDIGTARNEITRATVTRTQIAGRAAAYLNERLGIEAAPLLTPSSPDGDYPTLLEALTRLEAQGDAKAKDSVLQIQGQTTTLIKNKGLVATKSDALNDLNNRIKKAGYNIDAYDDKTGYQIPSSISNDNGGNNDTTTPITYDNDSIKEIAATNKVELVSDAPNGTTTWSISQIREKAEQRVKAGKAKDINEAITVLLKAMATNKWKLSNQ